MDITELTQKGMGVNQLLKPKMVTYLLGQTPP
jgi:hypothetical protein